MPKITGLAPQKRDPQRWSIYVDSRFFAGCTEGQLAEFDLHVGDEISSVRLDEIRESLGIARIRDAALRYLARRSRSEHEMKGYLARKQFDEAQIQTTLSWLREKGYLNDEQFAADWVSNRQQLAPRGRKRLLMELYQKGVSRETASETLKENLSSEAEAEAAYRALLSRKSRFKGMESLELKRKIYNFLSYRGFSPDAVESAWERFRSESETL
jgi:regulatory protein